MPLKNIRFNGRDIAKGILNGRYFFKNVEWDPEEVVFLYDTRIEEASLSLWEDGPSWTQTSASSDTAPNELMLPLDDWGYYNEDNLDLYVDWGDGTQDHFDVDWYDNWYNWDYGAMHTYDEPGIYTVRMKGSFKVLFGWFGDAPKLIDILQWGNVDRWAATSDEWDMCYTFSWCYSLKNISAHDVPVFDFQIPVGFFYDSAIETINNLGNWNLGNSKNLMDFLNLTNFNDPNISFLDVSGVEIFGSVFRRTPKFNQPLNSWDVSNATFFSNMFQDAYSFNQPLDNWDISNATSINSMFRGTKAFNQPLNSWDVSNITNMSFVFQDSEAFNQSLNDWDMSNKTNLQRMFYNAKAFNGDINDWDVSNVTDFLDFLRFAESFNKPLNNWNLHPNANLISFFRNASSFDQDISNFPMAKVFRTASSHDNLTNTNLSPENCSKVLHAIVEQFKEENASDPSSSDFLKRGLGYANTTFNLGLPNKFKLTENFWEDLGYFYQTLGDRFYSWRFGNGIEDVMYVPGFLGPNFLNQLWSSTFNNMPVQETDDYIYFVMPNLNFVVYNKETKNMEVFETENTRTEPSNAPRHRSLGFSNESLWFVEMTGEYWSGSHWTRDWYAVNRDLETGDLIHKRLLGSNSITNREYFHTENVLIAAITDGLSHFYFHNKSSGSTSSWYVDNLYAQVKSNIVYGNDKFYYVGRKRTQWWSPQVWESALVAINGTSLSLLLENSSLSSTQEVRYGQEALWARNGRNFKKLNPDNLEILENYDLPIEVEGSVNNFEVGDGVLWIAMNGKLIAVSTLSYNVVLNLEIPHFNANITYSNEKVFIPFYGAIRVFDTNTFKLIE